MRTHSQAPINQDPCACLLGHWFPRQAVYLSYPGRCVCVGVCCLCCGSISGRGWCYPRCLAGGSERTVPVHGVPWGLSVP